MLSECRKQSPQGGLVLIANARREVLVKPSDLGRTSRVARLPCVGDRRFDAAPISGIVDPLDQPVALETVDELRHIGSNATQTSR